MYVHYSENQITLHWTVFRGVSACPEDFSRSKVVCLLDSHSNKIPVGVEVVQGGKGSYLSLAVPTGLSEGVYDLQAVWTKNEGRSIARSRIDGAFAVTQNAEESTDKGGASLETVLRFHSSAGTYGYDGLSAYELALLKGLTTKSETKWVEEQIDTAVERIETSRDEALADIQGEETSAVTAIQSTTSQGLTSIDATIAEAEAAVGTVKETAIAEALSAIGSAEATAVADATAAVETAGQVAVASVETAKEDALDEIAEAIQHIDLTYDILDEG